jgi:hypothetical protein
MVPYDPEGEIEPALSQASGSNDEYIGLAPRSSDSEQIIRRKIRSGQCGAINSTGQNQSARSSPESSDELSDVGQDVPNFIHSTNNGIVLNENGYQTFTASSREVIGSAQNPGRTAQTAPSITEVNGLNDNSSHIVPSSGRSRRTSASSSIPTMYSEEAWALCPADLVADSTLETVRTVRTNTGVIRFTDSRLSYGESLSLKAKNPSEVVIDLTDDTPVYTSNHGPPAVLNRS